MSRRANPFEELYVSDSIPPADFVKLFSNFLVPHALPLFQPGNVVLKGVQGSGKSMLLSLFDPAIRLAYADAKADFPVPLAQRNFLSAGINLRKSNAMAFGQRPIHDDPLVDAQQFPIYFGDFFNYWIVLDLLRTLENYLTRAPDLMLSWGVSGAALDGFAEHLALDPCWFGALDGVQRFGALQAALQLRIGTYFRFLNWNVDVLPPELCETKTMVGEPISRTALALRKSGVVPERLPVYIRVDQYEDLGDIASRKYGELGRGYQRVINRQLGMRDANVSYRIGVRPYAWKGDLTMLGTTSQLEREREYTVVDLEQILSRKENRKTYIFDKFADDVMSRRLEQNGYQVDLSIEPVTRRVFGRGLSADEETRKYIGSDRSEARALASLGLSVSWPRLWREFLLSRFAQDPFSARLAAAWALQQRGQRLNSPPPQPGERAGMYPWDREYWKKERKAQALMQLASTNHQKLVWAGEQDVQNLSGGNILVFLSLCRAIWAAWIRANHDTLGGGEPPYPVPTIAADIQTMGAEEASEHWYGKITALPGGNHRQRFVDLLGRTFRRELLTDESMSYPGRNGFSVRIDQLEAAEDVSRFLEDAVDYGELVDAPHTTKEKDRRRRRKYFLRPILSPKYGLPATHIKEPMYISVEELRMWVCEATGPVRIESGAAPQASNSQINLALE